MKKNLKKSGFKKNWIYETIITTESSGKVHAAPMGVSSRNLETLILAVYKTSQTYKNIDETGLFAVNFTADIELFYQSLYQRKKIKYKKTKQSNLSRIKGADAFICARIISKKDGGEKMFYEAEILFFEGKKKIDLINRADALALEALIKASRIKSVNKKDKQKLIEELRYTVLASSKVAPKSSAARICAKTLLRF